MQGEEGNAHAGGSAPVKARFSWLRTATLAQMSCALLASR